MQKYQSIISGTNGSVIRNVPVTVLKEDGSLAEIFLDREGQVPAPNPLATDSRGVFYFYAKNGRYSLRTSVDGITITDADAVLLNDPEELATAGPIADAVLRAEAAAQRAEVAVEASGIPELVAAAQNAVVDANNAVGQVQAAASLADTAKNESAAAKVAAENAQSGAQSASAQAGQARVDAQTAAQAAAQSAASIDPAYLRNRANHTGTQVISTVAGLQDTLDSKADISAGATHLSLHSPEAPTVGRLQVFQRSGDPEMMPDIGWWSLLRIQHAGYPAGYWQDFVMPFQSGGRPRVRQNIDGVKSAWQELAYTSDVAQAIAMAATFTTVPATFQAMVIVVTQPHTRVMLWDGTKYNRAPWHAPGQLGYFLRDVPAGHVEVRSDVVLNKSDFPDLAEYLGVTGSTFVLDETRGEFLRSLDSGRGKDAGRVVGSHQGDAGRNLTGNTSVSIMTYQGASGVIAGTGAFVPTVVTDAPDSPRGTGTVSMPKYLPLLQIDASRQWPVADEFRVTNRAYRLAVQY